MHEFRGDPLDIFESITDAFFILDDEWHLTYLNAEAERILFRSREEILGKNLWEEFSEAFGSTFYREYHKAVEEWVTVEFEEYYLPLESWFEVKAYPSEAGLLVYLRDITKRKQAEKELKESEANYRALLEDLPELICRSLPDLTRAYVNEGYCRYFGKSKRELIGRSFLELLPEEDHEPLKEHLASLSRENPVGTFEHRVWRHDGEVRWQQWTNRAIYDEQGRFVGYHAVGRDFNVRRLAEEALKESEEHFRSLTDATFEGIVISEEETILETNQAFAEMFGYQLPEIRGMSILEFHAPEFREQMQQRISSTPDGSYESVGMRKDGSTFEVEIHERTAPHGDGGAVRVSAVRDITERKQAEEALRRSEERLQGLAEAAFEGILISDEGEILEVNQAFVDLTGYKPREVIGRSALEFVAPEYRDQVRQNIRSGLEGPYEIVGTRKDGTRLALEVRGKTSSFRQRPIRVTAIRDITERKRAEEALQSSETRFRSVVESIGEGLLITDVDDVVLYANSRITELTGYTAEEMLGRPAYELLLPQEQWPEILEHNRRRVRGEAERYEMRLKREDGGTLWTEINATPYRNIAGEVIGTLGAITDITERKQAEETIRQSEERFRSLIQNSSDIITILEADGTVRYTSPSMERVLGYKPEERIGKRALDDVHPEDREKMTRALAEALTEDKTTSRLEYRFRHANGSWRYLESIGNNLLDAPGVRGVVVNSRDITERKQVEKALRESEERYRALVQYGSDIISILDADGTLRYESPAVERVLGYQPGDLVGTNAFDYIHPDDLENLQSTFLEVAANDVAIATEEYRFRHADGSWCYIESIGINLLDDPSVNGIVVNSRDITERKRTEEKLRQSEERFRSAFENASTGVALVSPNRRYLRVNHALCEMLGYEEEELLGKISFKITHPEDQEKSEARTRRLLSGESVAESLEKRYLRKDGEVIWVRSDVSLVRDEESNPSHFVSQFQDISERKRAEEALQESEQRFRQLFEQSVDALFVHDEEGRFVDCNSQACHLLGYSREELLSLSVGDISCNTLTEEERAQKRREGGTLWDHAMTGEPGVFVVSHEEENRRKDGTTFPVEVRLGSVDYGGRRMILASTRDITERKQAEAKLEAQTAKLREQAQILDLAPVLIRDLDDKILLWNTGAKRIYGYSREEALGRTTHELLQSEHPEPVEQIKEKILREGRWEGEITHTRKDGKHIVVASLQVLHRDEQGEPSAIVEVSNDVTERKLAEETLNEQQDFLREVIDINPNLIFVKNRDGKFTLVNKAVANVYGTTVEELVGQSDADFASNEEEVEGFLRADREVIETLQEKYIPEEPITDSRTGEVRWFQTTKVPLVSSNSQSHRVLGVSTDITERKALEEQLRRQALHDSLTGLPNRVLFMDNLERALAGASRWRRKTVAVLFMDLDDFKVVNDSLGHEAGDQLLVAVSERLRECLRPMDIAARFGGDEFAILVRDVEDVSAAVRVAERVTAELLQAPFVLGEQEVFSAPSIGIALSSSRWDTPEDLLRKADAAMYRAKHRKTYYQVFDPAMGARATERLRLATDLRKAIDSDELKVCYQPKVELASGKVVGTEALLRWEHPERGLMRPGDFIPLAEDTGLIVPVGRWVLEQACRQAKEWHELYPGDPPLAMSVNLSARQFQHSDLVAYVIRILEETGLEPSALNLEITESLLMEDVQSNTVTLQQLKELGAKLLIDDFGTGYSSLSYLKRLPIDFLKIDRSFVNGLGRRSGDLNVASVIVSLAHTFGLGVVAEGVENKNQLARLQELGCDLAQGNYFSKPLSSEAASEFLASSMQR